MLSTRVRPYLFIFVLLTFLLQSLAAEAAVYRPPIGGYRYGQYLYSDANVLASKGCSGAWFVHHLEFTPKANAPGPDVAIYCGMNQPNGTHGYCSSLGGF